MLPKGEFRSKMKLQCIFALVLVLYSPAVLGKLPCKYFHKLLCSLHKARGVNLRVCFGYILRERSTS